MKKMTYNRAEIVVNEFETRDVITTSAPNTGDNDTELLPEE